LTIDQHSSHMEGDEHTARVKVATKAQMKLCHIVLAENVWFISSIAKRTPPIGDPNATATPAALDAVTISRILAGARQT